MVVNYSNYFHLAANISPVLIWIAATDKRCIWFNKIWLDFTGRTMEEEIGNGWAEGVHPDDLARCLEIYISHFDAREPFTMEYRIKHHSGEYRWLLDNGVPMFGESGEFIGYTGACTDISIQKQHDKTSMLLRHASDGIHILNRAGYVVECSDSFCTILGYSREEIIGMHVSQWDAGIPKKQLAKVLDEEFKKTICSQFETLHRRRNGTVYDVEISASVAADFGDEKVLFCSVRDITERKKYENNLILQNEEKQQRAIDLIVVNEKLAIQNAEKDKYIAELAKSYEENKMLNRQVNHMQKLESIGRMTSGIAHDFNNILACMTGYNEMNRDVAGDITDPALKAELEQNTTQIHLAGKRAIDLINKMLTYCRQDISTKKITVKPIREVINEVLTMLRPGLTSRIQMEFKNLCQINHNDCSTCGVRNSCEIEIDATDLHQILTNLAVNARDAMKQRGGIITFSLNTVTDVKAICLACTEILEGDFIELSVSDNGEGIAPEIIYRLFDPFFTTKPQGEGTGLGLSTVSGLVHQSGGHILVESSQGESNHGTSFKLLFPMQ